MTRALILSGGGQVGIAWESGLTQGLLEEGIDLRRADVIVGTSGGSVVAARLALGHDPAAIEPFEFTADPAAPGGSVPQDIEAFQRFVSLRRSVPAMTPEVAREIGKVAVAARTVREQVFLTNILRELGTEIWPEQDLVISAVSCGTGELVGWRKGEGATLVQAVGASCGAPGHNPAVHIGHDAYMDGGVYPATCCELALAFRPTFSLIVRVIGTGLPAATEAAMRGEAEREAKVLEAAGSKVMVILPEGELPLMGPNLLAAPDPALRGRAVARGRALAGALRRVW
jgi:NTE family protein